MVRLRVGPLRRVRVGEVPCRSRGAMVCAAGRHSAASRVRCGPGARRVLGQRIRVPRRALAPPPADLLLAACRPTSRHGSRTASSTASSDCNGAQRELQGAPRRDVARGARQRAADDPRSARPSQRRDGSLVIENGWPGTDVGEIKLAGLESSPLIPDGRGAFVPIGEYTATLAAASAASSGQDRRHGRTARGRGPAKVDARARTRSTRSSSRAPMRPRARPGPQHHDAEPDAEGRRRLKLNGSL